MEKEGNNELWHNLPEASGNSVRIGAISFVLPDIWQYACYNKYIRLEHANELVRYG